jgi:hypothetical protein
VSDFVSPAALAERAALPPPTFDLWRCPLCRGSGRWADGEGCHECYGRGLVADEPNPQVWCGDGEHVRAPLPPALMPAPCGDCAFRSGSPELEYGGTAEDGAPARIDAARPFYCHHGLHQAGGEYVPSASWQGAPLGAMLCRGWWNHYVEQAPPPARPYREPKEKARS